MSPRPGAFWPGWTKAYVPLALVDASIPTGEGFASAERLQQRLPKLPVVVLDALATADGERRAAELGLARFLELPLDPRLLYTGVTRLVRKRG